MQRYNVLVKYVKKTYLFWNLLGHTVTFLFWLLIANFFGM